MILRTKVCFFSESFSCIELVAFSLYSYYSILTDCQQTVCLRFPALHRLLLRSFADILMCSWTQISWHSMCDLSLYARWWESVQSNWPTACEKLTVAELVKKFLNFWMYVIRVFLTVIM